MKAVHRSDIGKVRAVNEDRAYAATLPNGYTLVIVADGMGGHQAGDIASRLAVETVVNELRQLPSELDEKDREDALKSAIFRANDTIYHIASQDEKYNNMGTTIVAALLQQEEGTVAHIGDSRAYIISPQHIRQLTDDHTLVNELLKSGQITQEEANHHPRRNVLTRALGTDARVRVDVAPLRVEQDETLLLCSDGLTNMISTKEIWSTIVDPSLPLEVIADRLIEQAVEAGGDDNVTVILAQAQASVAEKVGWNS
ncbi:Stp1/IreP family PP2C-type Ser/Thr phosphatase [Paenibacillus sp. SC116]|uniref:Stp1/IreP family PP2C-type Ser/Thr phosphatase n=1 Tax=Paenibacillus sp. SC116 TaxID=2968986 RepID=UPI00215A561F|nr:Stp1/IreP family PP2C-type Ser/Thr phosphatase [Paenibacillus sp. SC116]MCR8845264.1 Stp1/IreP family PP2C-type Ser/Thr phosphatase [Paenibacillus sp. SC116]